jgi:hypothetical protein
MGWPERAVDFPEKILKKERSRTRSRVDPHQMRLQGGCSEQDDSASGFAWVAREPKLMFGAEGRASSQRF